ncbi:hypothetical protein ACNHYB_12435 [Isoptericola jiangsuensis]|uniref:hypothetical protein n=1 Tax=Isoptericola jiangsuensis TaxID=548579 RepID=UPI003AAD96C0
MRHPVRPLAVVLGLLCALALSLLPTAAHADDTETPTDTPLVLAGVAGLQWTDVDAARTPNLWRLVGGGSVASVSVRTLTPTCPRDAWLSLSAGSRVVTDDAQDPQAGDDDSGDDSEGDGDGETEQTLTSCPPLPVPPGSTTPEPTRVPGWSTLVDDEELPTSASPGALGALAETVGTCTTAAGPGGALALADPDGDVERYVTDAADLTDVDVAACPVTVVDLGELPDTAAERIDAVAEVDDAVGRLADLLPDGGRLVVAGLADTPLGPADLQVVVDWTAPGGSATWLSSTSSRWPGVVVTGDLSATLADALLQEADPQGGQDEQDEQYEQDEAVTEAAAAFTGSPLQRGEDRRLSVARTVENRQYLSVLTETLPRMTPVLVGAMALAVVAVVVSLGLSRRRTPTGHGTRLALATLVVAAVVPVAATLATLTRWWVGPAPVTVLSLAVAGIALLVAAAAWWARLLLPRPGGVCPRRSRRPRGSC